MQNLLKRILYIANRAFDYILLVLMLLIALLGIYFIWDAGNTYSQAQSRVFRQYKPSVEEGDSSYRELVALNDDVKAWLTVYDTGIDYPVVQSADNRYYLNRDVEKKYSTPGSIYIDSSCSSDFSDFNTIIYGHHMAYGAMFGDLDKFEDKKYFNKHRWGSIYYNGREKEIEFYAFIDSADGYDTSIYSYNINSAEDKTLYLKYLAERAKYYRNTGVSPDDRIVLLSTCSQSMTNGRYILVGVFRERDKAKSSNGDKDVGMTWKDKIRDIFIAIPLFLWIIIVLQIIFIIILHILIWMKRKDERKRRE